MKEESRMVSDTEMVSIDTQMVMSFKVNGKTIKNYTEFISLVKVIGSREDSNKMKSVLG